MTADRRIDPIRTDSTQTNGETSMSEAPSTGAPGLAQSCLHRRTVLGACGAGLVAALTGCATYGGSSSEEPAAATSAPASAPAGSPAASAAPAGFATVADIPVGGGKIFADQKVVVTQPTKGTIKAFSVTCTHQGCTVDEVEDGTINCPCHGSKFRVADGSVANGPAGRPLPSVSVTVSGDSIALG